MKHNYLVAALALLAAGTASAQSSVTIYGRLNASVEYIERDNDNKHTELVNNASRLGFRGTEDLGGGLKASFILEHGFNVDTGTPSQTGFWARQSEINLSGGFGMIRLGNFFSEAYYATADYISMHNHDTGNSEDKLYAYLGRNGNKIAYRTPEFVKGLTLEGGVTLPESAKNTGNRRTYDFALNFGAGPLAIGVGYEKNETIGVDAEQFAVRALYEIGPVVLGAYVQRDENGWGANLGQRTSARVSAAFNFGASEFHLNYGHADKYKNFAGSEADQGTVAYNYNLSKRTKVYAFYTQVDDEKKIYGAGGDFKSVALGVRHNF